MGSIRHLHVAAATLLAFAVALPASAAAVHQPPSGFGAPIAFSPNAYTPQGVTSLVYSPLASQDRSRFGAPVAFGPSAYTPQGIASLVYSPLASQDRSRFGAPVAFRPSAYTPQGIASPHLLDTAAIP